MNYIVWDQISNVKLDIFLTVKTWHCITNIMKKNVLILYLASGGTFHNQSENWNQPNHTVGGEGIDQT